MYVMYVMKKETLYAIVFVRLLAKRVKEDPVPQQLPDCEGGEERRLAPVKEVCT